MKIEKELEDLKPIIKELEKLGYRNVYVDFRSGTIKFAIKIRAEKSKKNR